MPRRRPDQVVTHRLELGTFERGVVESKLISDSVVGIAGAAAVAIGGLGATGIAALFLAGQAPELLTDIQSVAKKYNPITNISTIIEGAKKQEGESWWDLLDPTFWTEEGWSLW